MFNFILWCKRIQLRVLLRLKGFTVSQKKTVCGIM